MFKNIVEIVKEYNDNNKIADQNFYERIYDVFKQYLGDDTYLKQLIVIRPEEHTDPKYDCYTSGFAGLFGQAAYRSQEQEMVIYMRTLNHMASMTAEKLCQNNKNMVSAYNLLIMQTLLHEFEHVLQEMKLKTGNDLESNLLRAVYSSEEETVTSYDCSLEERLAEIRAYQQVLKMYDLLCVDNQALFEYLNQRLLETYLSGYQFLDDNGYINNDETGNFVSSTDYYVSLRNCDKKKYHEIASTVEGFDRLLYGLSIPVEVYKQYKNKNRKTL